MKRFVRTTCTLLAALLLGWYFSPQVYHVLHLPDVVDRLTEMTAPALAEDVSEARFVRNSEDERIEEASEQTKRITLFGVLPLKSVAVSANQRTVAVSGKAIGVVLKTEGVQIVGFEKIETETGGVCPAISAGLREGDMIVQMDGKPIAGSDDFSRLCAEADERCTLTYLRDGETHSVTLSFATDQSGDKRIGAWVRDSTSGIGTLSFYDRTSGLYAALGHGVTDVDTQKLIAPATGFITDAAIQRIRKGESDQAGELIGRFSVNSSDAIGTIERNTLFGIGGTLTAFSESNARVMEIAQSGAAHKGDAYILSDVDGSVSAYSVRVIRVDVQSSPETQGMMIEITDPSLLDKTGGIVQGMSGSPLIQDGRLIGVVTHVFLSQPTRGYCIYAERMSDELLP